MKFAFRLWTLTTALLAVLVMTPPGLAQDAQVRGRIKSASAKHVTVATSHDPRITFRITDRTAVTVGGVASSPRKLKPGYRVRIDAVWTEFGGLEAVTVQASH